MAPQVRLRVTGRAVDLMEPVRGTVTGRSTVGETMASFAGAASGLLPAVDDEGNLTGVVTPLALVKHLARGGSEKDPVEPMLDKDVICVKEQTSWEDLLRPGKQDARLVVVTDEDNRVTGFIPREKLVAALSAQVEELSADLRLVLDSTFNGMVVVDAEGRVIIFNTAVEPPWAWPPFSSGKSSRPSSS